MPGVQELVVIALVALFVLGPERLPEVMRAGGRLLVKARNYGVTASKELRGVAELGGLGNIEREVSELRRELDRTRADLRRAMLEMMASNDMEPPLPGVPVEPVDPIDPVEQADAEGETPDARG